MAKWTLLINTLPQLTWKCTDRCRKTAFLLKRGFWHFHVSWWEGTFVLLGGSLQQPNNKFQMHTY